jgi:hypothetical protein
VEKELVVHTHSLFLFQPQQKVQVLVLPQYFLFFLGAGFATFPDLKVIALTLGLWILGFKTVWAGSWFVR